MEKIETYKDIRTIASVSALVGVATMSIYFQNKISKIETDLSEVQEHLAAIIPQVGHNSKQQIEQVMKAVRVLDSRIAQTQSELDAITSRTLGPEKGRPKKYVRLTKPSHRNHSIEEEEPTTKIEEESDIEEDVVAMMN